MSSRDSKWNEETKSGTYSDKIHHGEMKRGWENNPVLSGKPKAMTPIQQAIEWRPIKGYEGYYEVSFDGQVKSLDRYVDNRGRKTLIKGVVMRLNKSTQGYWNIQLYNNSIGKGIPVHRLVAQAFIPNPENKPCINHKDGNKQNNRIDNLEWCTYQENNIHARKMGLIRATQGVRHAKAILTERQVKEIRSLKKKYGDLKKLAAKYGVSPGTIGSITRNESWKHLLPTNLLISNQ